VAEAAIGQPGYPVSLYFGDFEHLTSLVKIADLRQMHDEATVLLGATCSGGASARADVRAEVTDCDPKCSDRCCALPAGTSWRLTTSASTTSSRCDDVVAGPRPARPALDPVVASQLRGRGCFTTTTPPVPTSWTVTPAAPFTMAGLRG